MNEWLTATADALAAETGVGRERLQLSDQEAATLLDIARVAAHDGGERTNAPLLCYLVGLCVANSPASLDQVAKLVGGSSSE